MNPTTRRLIATPLRWMTNLAFLFMLLVAGRGVWDVFHGGPFLTDQTLLRLLGVAGAGVAAGHLADRILPAADAEPKAPPRSPSGAVWITRYNRLWYVNVVTAAVAGGFVGATGSGVGLVAVAVAAVTAVAASVAADSFRDPSALEAQTTS